MLWIFRTQVYSLLLMNKLLTREPVSSKMFLTWTGDFDAWQA